ncbi:MAG TPA: ABC transporter permease [Thermoplasmataceae archaeon]|nr:ABC transporter permease [Thermoplasmataceae archaeon]
MELRYFVLRRVLLIIPTVIGITVLVFILLRSFPDSLLVSAYINPHSTLPRQEQIQIAKEQLGLNLPVPVQYFYYISNLLKGNWGFVTKPFPGPVLLGIELFMPNSIQLAIFSSILSILLAIPIGTYIGSRPNTFADQAGRVFSLVGYAMPPFVLGILLILAFGQGVSNWGGAVLPFNGVVNVPTPVPHWLLNQETGFIISSPTHLVFFDALIHGNLGIAWSAFLHLILPVVTLTYTILAGLLRFIRAGMVDATNQEYVKTARSKGVPEGMIIKRHIRRNALIPTITVMGLLIAALLSGVVVIEILFTYHGLGWFAVTATLDNQIYGVLDTTLVFGLILVFANLIVDIVYAFMDPRIRY